MKIEKDRVVLFHYSVSTSTGSTHSVATPGADAPAASEGGEAPMETSKGGDPMAILVGHGNIIPGLEKALDGREAGDSFGVDVVAAEAYGELREGMGQRVPKKHFGGQRLEPGMQVVMQTNFGPRAVTIQKVGMSVVDVDLNHPMAGKDLHFDIEVVEVREARPEELEHGHVHGAGGHQH